MPFNEAEAIKSTGGASLQFDTAVKYPNSTAASLHVDGKARAEPLGNPADLVEATTAEVHQYHKVLNYPAKTYPHGVFFLLSPQKAIIACSANTQELFGSEASALIGKTFSDLFESSSKVAAALTAEDMFAVSPVVTKSKGGASSTVNIILQRGPNGIMADVEPLDDDSEKEVESKIDAVQAAVGKFEACNTEQELCDQMTSFMKEIWGWDWQVVWKFNEDDTSVVVSEKCTEKVANPLKGLTLYSEDMPPNAKLDFLQRTYSRITVDVTTPGVDLVTNESVITPEEVSLKASSLRQLHQCAIGQYGEWGVVACACFPIILHRRLWGICIHSHTTPQKLCPFQVRLAMEQLTQTFALRLAKILDKDLSAREEAFTAFTAALAKQASSAADEAAKLKLFVDAAPELGKAVPAVSAVAVYHKGKVSAAGGVSEGDAQKVVTKILESWKPATKEATAYQSLTDLSPELSSVAGAAGVVAVPLMQDSVLLLFRPESNTTVNFAGVKTVMYNRATGRMHSRRDSKSPTAVKQAGKCQEWAHTDVDAARALSGALSAILSGSAEPAAGSEVVGMDAAAQFEVAERLRKLEDRVGQLAKELKAK